MARLSRFLLGTVALLFVLLSIAAIGAWIWLQKPLVLDEPEVVFIVQPGDTFAKAAQRAQEAGVRMDHRLLYGLARIQGKGEGLKAGSYAVKPGMNAWNLVDLLSDGALAMASLTIPEGWRFSQFRAALEAHPDILPDTLGHSNEALFEKLGLDLPNTAMPHPEGLFFPDTYVFGKKSSALSVLALAHQQMRQRLDEAWGLRRPDSPLKTPYELLILASIIEKETGRADERGLVSSVFTNRLRKPMRLQTDPTVIYGFGDSFNERLRKRHLATDHPWNTYIHFGLPPTPIALPGWESLKAAAQPPDSDYYYFVARGDGTSAFSRTYTEHGQAVNRYQRSGGAPDASDS
jgi:UPF0755 protein